MLYIFKTPFPSLPFFSHCALIKHKCPQSDITNQGIFHYSFILSDLFLSRLVLSRLWAGDVDEIWILLGPLSGTEYGYSLLLILMEAVPKGGASTACHERLLFSHRTHSSEADVLRTLHLAGCLNTYLAKMYNIAAIHILASFDFYRISGGLIKSSCNQTLGPHQDMKPLMKGLEGSFNSLDRDSERSPITPLLWQQQTLTTVDCKFPLWEVSGGNIWGYF